jgi:hypothetical protein
MCPNAGGGGMVGFQPMSTAVHNAHGAQINFGDPYLTYGCEDSPVSNSTLHSQDFIFSLMTQIVNRGQRVLNDLLRNRLSYGRMIRFLFHLLLPSSPVPCPCLSFSVCLCVAGRANW